MCNENENICVMSIIIIIMCVLMCEEENENIMIKKIENNERNIRNM